MAGVSAAAELSSIVEAATGEDPLKTNLETTTFAETESIEVPSPSQHSLEQDWNATREQFGEAENSPEDVSKLLRITQDRLDWLERQLRRRKRNKSYSEDSSVPSSDDEDSTEILPEVRYVDWFAFKNSKYKEKQPAIEVLLGRPRYYYETRNFHTVDGSVRTPWDEPEDADIPIHAENQDDDIGTRHVPERIRINSSSILAVFSAMDLGNWRTESTVLLRPYKFLVEHESKIRNVLEQLEKKWSGRPELQQRTQDLEQTKQDVEKEINHRPTRSQDLNASADEALERSNTHVAGGNDATDVSLEGLAAVNSTKDDIVPRIMAKKHKKAEDLTAFLHLRCLMDFYDRDVKPVVDALRNRSCRRVRFSNMWYLFRPGDILYYPLGSTPEDPLRGATDKQPRAMISSNASKVQAEERVEGRYQTLYRHMFSLDGRSNLCPGEKDEKNLPPAAKINHFYIDIYYLDYNGRDFYAVRHFAKIAPFEGVRDIVSLSIYPIMYNENHDAIISAATTQGRRFLDFRTPKLYEYAGPTWEMTPNGTSTVKPNASSGGAKRYEDIDGQVIIDFRESKRTNPYWVYNIEALGSLGSSSDSRELEEDDRLAKNIWDSRDRNYPRQTVADTIQDDDFVEAQRVKEFTLKDTFLVKVNNNFDDDDEMDISHTLFTDKDFALLPNRAFAFYFRNREWVQVRLDADKLKLAEISKTGFNSLKLREGHKLMVKSLVRNHFEAKRIRTTRGADRGLESDIIRGRGNGLVILLHGAPGTGKTSTAESVAELTGKPLLTVTCGDLGLTAEEVEKSLQLRFHQAQLWDCVLLIDEADVFLAARNRTDLQRNAIVAVFLRVLEYYSGILFLTTNRVGAFDEAFKSRIHMSLYYPPLSIEQTMAIWKMNLTRLKERFGDRLVADQAAILAYAEQHFWECSPKQSNWNGRQIRNAFQTALALAEYDAEDARAKASNDADPAVTGSTVPIPLIKLEVKYFKAVARASTEFDMYLAETNKGNTAADIAYAKTERADHIGWDEAAQLQFNPAREYRGNYPEPQGMNRQQPFGNPPGGAWAPQRPGPPTARFSGPGPPSDEGGFSPPRAPNYGDQGRSPYQSYQPAYAEDFTAKNPPNMYQTGPNYQTSAGTQAGGRDTGQQYRDYEQPNTQRRTDGSTAGWDTRNTSSGRDRYSIDDNSD